MKKRELLIIVNAVSSLPLTRQIRRHDRLALHVITYYFAP